MLITASASSPPVLGDSWEARQEGVDAGLISAWIAGRDMRERAPALVQSVLRGELPVLPFKGGVEKKIKGSKVGALQYLAMWQGLRGDDLHVALGSRPIMRCSRTAVQVYFTDDVEELGRAGVA